MNLDNHDNNATNALMDEWKRLTSAGVDAHRAHCAAHALAWHEQALRVAHELLYGEEGINVSDDDRLAAFVIAHLNLAECFEALDQSASAEECLHCAHHRLAALMHSPTAPESMRMAACKHIRYTWTALSEHHASHPERTTSANALHDLSVQAHAHRSTLH